MSILNFGTIRRLGEDRANTKAPTQTKAIKRARELNAGVTPHVGRVRVTNGEDDIRRKP